MQGAAELNGVGASGDMAARGLDQFTSEDAAQLDVDLVGGVAAAILPGEQDDALGAALEGVEVELAGGVLAQFALEPVGGVGVKVFAGGEQALEERVQGGYDPTVGVELVEALDEVHPGRAVGKQRDCGGFVGGEVAHCRR